MQRRPLLRLASSVAVAGTAGCARLPVVGRQYRLWFVKIHNGTAQEQQVEIRVRRDDELLFEREFQAIPSFQNDETEKASYAAMPSARLIENEWAVRKGSYSVEYQLADEDSFEVVDVESIEEFDAEDVGVEMQLYGGELSQASIGLNVLEFDSAEQAGGFLTTVTNQTDR